MSASTNKVRRFIEDNPIVGKDYNKLVIAMMQCAAVRNLPQPLDIKDTSKVTLDDVLELISRFEDDTGLYMSFTADLNEETNKLSCSLFIDFKDEDLQPKQTFLQ